MRNGASAAICANTTAPLPIPALPIWSLALKGKPIFPRIHVEGDEKITYAVSCRHCEDPICVKSCIAGALSKKDGVIGIDHNKCVGCLTCVLVCPYGALAPGETASCRNASSVSEKCLRRAGLRKGMSQQGDRL